MTAETGPRIRCGCAVRETQRSPERPADYFATTIDDHTDVYKTHECNVDVYRGSTKVTHWSANDTNERSDIRIESDTDTQTSESATINATATAGSCEDAGARVGPTGRADPSDFDPSKDCEAAVSW